MSNPKINIEFSKELDPIFTAYVLSNPKWESFPIPSTESVLQRVKDLQNIWSEWGDKILTEMIDIVGHSFEESVIDVHIVSVNPRPFAHPIVIRSGVNTKEFGGCDAEETINIIVHELLHVLLPKKNKRLKEIWLHSKEKYQNNDNILVHYIIFTVMNEIYRRIGKTFSSEEMIKTEKNKEYARAKEMAVLDPEYILTFLNK